MGSGLVLKIPRSKTRIGRMCLAFLPCVWFVCVCSVRILCLMCDVSVCCDMCDVCCVHFSVVYVFSTVFCMCCCKS